MLQYSVIGWDKAEQNLVLLSIKETTVLIDSANAMIIRRCIVRKTMMNCVANIIKYKDGRCAYLNFS